MADWFSIGAAGISALANLGGGFMSASGAANANAQNLAQQNMINQQMLNAQMATHEQNTAFMEDQQAFNAQQQAIAQSFNADQATINRDWSAGQAQRQMDFQERMSNTAYQRAMRDMRAAGLNPILAYQQGGAVAPGGAMGSGSAASVSPASSGMASAQGAPHLGTARMENTAQEIGRAVGRIASSAVDTYKTSEQAKLTGRQADTQDWMTDKVMHDAAISRDMRFKVNADTDNARSQNEVIKAQADMVRAQAGAARARASVDAETARQFAKNGLPGYGLGERVLRELGTSGAPVRLLDPSWPFNN